MNVFITTTDRNGLKRKLSQQIIKIPLKIVFYTPLSNVNLLETGKRFVSVHTDICSWLISYYQYEVTYLQGSILFISSNVPHA